MQNITRNIFITFALFTHWLTTSAYADSLKVVSVSGDSPVFRDYYSLLQNISKEPYDQQKEKLELFIENNPRFERSYHQLLSTAFLANNLDDVEKFLKAKLDFEPTRRNCIWALSKISAARDSSDAALQRLGDALKQPVPTPYLLMEFAHHHSLKNRQTFLNALDKLGISDTDRHIALSFYYSQKGDAALLDHVQHGYANPAFELYATSMIGNYYLSRHNFQASDSVYNAGIAQAKKLADEQFQVHFQLMLADVYFRRDSLQNAERFCQKAISQATEINDLERLASANNLHCQILMQQNKFNAALE